MKRIFAVAGLAALCAVTATAQAQSLAATGPDSISPAFTFSPAMKASADFNGVGRVAGGPARREQSDAAPAQDVAPRADDREVRRLRRHCGLVAGFHVDDAERVAPEPPGHAPAAANRHRLAALGAG